MAKVELDDVANLANTTSAQSTINNNSDTIETAFDNTLSRDGSSPNSMESDLDMDSHEILNLAAPGSNASAARLQDVLDQTTEDATSKPATAITIDDSGTHYTSDNVEGALQEVGNYTQVTATPAELNTLDGVTATTAEINKLDGLTSTTAELNLLDGITLSASDLQTLVNNYQETVDINLGGDFDAGQTIRCSRIGNTVTISSAGTLSHSSTSSADSAVGDIPSAYRPSQAVFTVSSVTLGGSSDIVVAKLQIRTDGSLSVTYYSSTGSGSTRTDTINGFTISYLQI